MLRTHRGCLALALSASLWAVPSAHAQTAPKAAPPSEPDVDQARQLFNEGLAFVEREDWVQAEDRFRRVLALRSSHVVSYNLASALTHLGRLVESAELLRAIGRDANADATTREAAAQLLSEIEPRIGSLTVRIAGDSEGIAVTLDDKPIEFSGPVQTLSVDPGEHRVAIQKAGAVMERKSLVLGGDAPLQGELAFELPSPIAPKAVAAAAPATPPPVATQIVPGNLEPLPSEPETRSRSLLERPWFWAGVGALVAGGVVTALLVSSPGKASPVAGDTNPPVIRDRVRAASP